MSVVCEIKVVPPTSFLEGLKSVKYFSEMHENSKKAIKLKERYKTLESFLDYLKENTKPNIPSNMSDTDFAEYVKHYILITSFTKENIAYIFNYLDLPESVARRFVKAFLKNDCLELVSEMKFIRNMQNPAILEGESELRDEFFTSNVPLVLFKIPTDNIMTLLHLFPEQERDYILREKFIYPVNGSTVLHFKCQRLQDIKDIIAMMKYIPFDYTPKEQNNNKPYNWLYKNPNIFPTKSSEFMQVFKEAYDNGDILCENEDSVIDFRDRMIISNTELNKRVDQAVALFPEEYRNKIRKAIRRKIWDLYLK